MEEWIILSLLTLLLWGFWGFSTKFASSYVNYSTLYVSTLVGSFLVSIYFLLTNQVSLPTNPKTLFIIILPGLIGAIAGIFFFKAISMGKGSIVIAITAAYPLLVTLLSALILKEAISPIQALGIVLSVIGISILAFS